MSRHLKPILYGDFTATVVAINIVTVLILFGSDNVVIKYLPGYLKSKDIKLISAFKYWNYKLIKKTFSICIIAFIALYLLLFIFSIHNIDITLSRHCSILVLCIAPFSALSVLLSNYILSGRLVSLFYLFNNLAMPFFLLLIFSSSALIFHFDMDYPYMIIFIFASYCVVIVVKLLIVMKIFKKVKLNLFKISSGLKLIKNPKWNSDSVKYISNKIALTFITSITIIIVQIAGREKFALGYYSAILTITSVILLIPMALSSLIKSNAAILIKENKYKELSKILNITNTVNILVCVFLFIIIIIIPKTILSSFGIGFESVYIPLIIQAAAYLISAVSTPSDKLLTLINVKAEIRINLVQLLSLIVLGFPLTYYLGLIGITLTILISVAIKSLSIYFCLKRTLPVRSLIFI
jgi:O-antigen/teichoic acid export membrane protein